MLSCCSQPDRVSRCCRAAYVNIACLGEGQPHWYALQVSYSAAAAAAAAVGAAADAVLAF